MKEASGVSFDSIDGCPVPAPAIAPAADGWVDEWCDEPGSGPDVIPVDTSGFDYEAWLTRLMAELSATETLEAAMDRTVFLRQEQARLMAEEQRELADLAARTRTMLGERAKPKDIEMAMRSLTAELAVLHRVSDRTMAARLAEAETLVFGFPSTFEYLELGRIQPGHVRTIIEHGLAIKDADLRARYELEVRERATLVTPGRLRRFAQLAAVRLAETAFEERHRQARAERRVVVTEMGDGMSELSVTMPTVLAQGVWDRLTQQAQAIHQAKGARQNSSERTFDQLRADLVAELLLTCEPSAESGAPHAAAAGIRAEVSIVVPILTLLGKSSEPATITGKGPIDLDTARELAGRASRWLRILTDPVTDLVLTADTYRPSKKLRRFLEARDGRCRFPSCNRSARRCDADHTIAWESGGLTMPDNLELLCQGHHTLKHYSAPNAPPWRVRQTENGELEWTTPHGRVVTDVPEGVPSGWRSDLLPPDSTGPVQFS